MSKSSVGLILPLRPAVVPPEPLEMYPDIEFVAEGLGLERLTPEGYDRVIDRVADTAQTLRARNVDAIMFMGTSLSFYRGAAFNEALTETMQSATNLPVKTMSTAMVEALHAMGSRRPAIATAYVDSVNRRLEQFLLDSGFEIASLEALNIDDVNIVDKVVPSDLVNLGARAFRDDADAIFISCGGLRTLDITVPLEERFGVPVATSATAGAWAAARLSGHSGRASGFGRLFQ